MNGWISSYEAELSRHLTRMLGSPDDAQDVLQQVWIRAYEHPPALGPDANVRAWLYRVGTNAALDHMARDRRRRDLLWQRYLPPTPAASEPPGLNGLSERVKDLVRKRCAELPPKQREAVWFRWVEEVDYATIARRLDTTVEGARANVYQGLKRLRHTLREVWDEEQRQ